MNETTPSRNPRRKRRLIHVRVDSAAPARAVWRLLADVTTWTDWAGFDQAVYERPGPTDPHGAGAVPRFRVGILRSRETVLVAEPEARLAYDHQGSLPLRDYRADVTLTSHASRTRITWHAEFSTSAAMLGPLLSLVLGRALRTIAGRLTRAAECAATC